jgi:L-ascorbate metabolism protein UlaG (beta-lactamase superfamily)
MKILSKFTNIIKSKYFIITTIILIAVMSISVYAWDMKRLGKVPSGTRLERIKKSPNYKEDQFVNQNPTVMGLDSSNFLSFIYKFLFEKGNQREPIDHIPSIKTDLLKLNRNEDVLVWFGHSSYFIQIDGKRFLIDPVLSTFASPFSFMVKAFKGATAYYSIDLPEIDYLVMTHDHWDHLDYNTIMAMKDKIKHIICPLGVGEHFEYWGFDTTKISEGDWYDSVDLSDNFKMYYHPQRHFSGRTIFRNKSLWTSYVLATPSMKIFIGGDGGYDKHFAEIGDKYNGIDLAIMENGQYNEKWKAIHSMPDQTIKAVKEMKAKRVLPVHSSKFTLAFHSWKEPLETISKLSSENNVQLVTPVIGEPIRLKDTTQKFQKWWEKVK